ncbi:MAG: DAK2 domain-containing protein [Firmicutes bacterium]|nr:DAK2 domain-containing protein [Bacillota bacterium]
MKQIDDDIVFLRGDDLRSMILEASRYFDAHKESINELNVFPVPDGDTGTNMSLTMKAAAGELQKIESLPIGEVAQVTAQSSLLGARGNSGVILAQLFRGIARGLSGKEVADLSEMGRAFQYGIVHAYNAVSKPVEGTILTVAREIAKGSREALQTSLSFIDLLRVAIDSGRKALEQTPELLPVLKEAGVVDAGGLGLIVFLEGCLQSMLKKAGREQDAAYPDRRTMLHVRDPVSTGEKKQAIVHDEEFNPDYPYCTEMLIKGECLTVHEIRRALERWGDSLIVAGGSPIVKVHIHTAHPGTVLETCLIYGTIHDIKIDNMIDQYQETRQDGAPEGGGESKVKKIPGAKPSVEERRLPGDMGVVTVSSGKGLEDIFISLGADKVVSGGQSMNPAVKDIAEAIMQIPAEKIIVLPNNSNIKLSAEQAAELIEKEIMVVDTNSIPQGLAALLALNRKKTLQENYASMCRRAGQVKSGEITYATRRAAIDNIRVEKGNIIGLSDGRLLVGKKTLKEAAIALVGKIIAAEDEILSLFYGQEVPVDEAQKLVKELHLRYPQLEIELQYGGQPLYYYLLLVE